MLRDPIYTGKIIFAKKVYDGTHDPIISQEMFDAVQAKYDTHMEAFLLAGNRTSYFQRTSLLSGIIFCGKCGARYYSLSKVYNLKSGEKVQYYYYRCYSRGGRKEMRKSDNCKNKNYKSIELNEIVIRQICSLAKDQEGIKGLIIGTSASQVDTKSVFQNGSLVEQQNLIRSLIKKIVIYPDNVEIHWLICE